MGQYNVAITSHPDNVAAVDAAVEVLKSTECIEQERRVRKGTGYITRSVDLADELFFDIEKAKKLLSNISLGKGVEVVWVLAQSTTDVFIYFHWQSGKLVRALICGEPEQCEWSRAEGETEEWEADAFEGEEVEGLNKQNYLLGWNEEKQTIRAPMVGELSLPPDAMKYAESAVKYFEKG